MSFASLKSKRRAKASRSYVTSTDNFREPNPTNTPNIVNSNNSGLSTSNNAGIVYYGVPNNVEMRVSSLSGRGLWAKSSIKAGS